MKQRILNSQRNTPIAGKLPTSRPLLSPTTAAATTGMRLNDPLLLRDSQPDIIVKQPTRQQDLKDGMCEDEENRDKENNEPQLNIERDDKMDVDDSLSSNDESTPSSSSSSDSLALSSDSDSLTRPVLSLIESSAKRLCYNTSLTTNNDDDEESQDDSSECSGDTVVANDFPDPPQNASEEEMNRYYWGICYGDNAEMVMESFRGNGGVRLPVKSCLSTKKVKKDNNPSVTLSSMTPRRLHPSPPTELTLPNTQSNNLSTPNEETQINTSKSSAVKFGTNSAAEFDKLLPITEMTPLPSTLVQQIFPSETKEEPQEQEVSRETARNVAMLAEWDDLFDDEELFPSGGTPKRKRRKRSFKKNRPSKSRRDSTIFSKDRKSLLEESDEEMLEGSMLPLSVTIDPVQYTSPSSASESRDLSETIGMVATQKRDSLDSACISPSSMASSVLKETPNSARNSSSTILRDVHESGAELPRSSPVAGGGLRPNQLNYSPRGGGMVHSDSSPSNSDNQSLGSDIMSLFTQHTIDSDCEVDPLQRQLSILSNHPLQMLHLHIGDMATMMQALSKDALQFLNEDVLRNLTPATALAFITGQDKDFLLCQLFESVFSLEDLDSIRAFEVFESILQRDFAKACEDHSFFGSFRKDGGTIEVEDEETIASCVKYCHDVASFEWSNIEHAITELSLNKLLDMAQNIEDTEHNKQPAPASEPIDVKRSIQDEMARIEALEKELAIESNRLLESKRAQQIIRSNLELERYKPTLCLAAELTNHILSSFQPFPNFHPADRPDFYYSLLDGSAEVTMEMDIENQQFKNAGFSIKDGGSPMKLLQAILLGRIEPGTSAVSYPAPIRSSIYSPLLDNQDMKKAFMDASHLFSRIDWLLHCVKMLEAEFLCTVELEPNGDVKLAFSTSQDGEVIKVVFTFQALLLDTWDVTTVPSDVKVSIVSVENDWGQLSTLLEGNACKMLRTERRNPFLLKTIINIVMTGFMEAKAA